MPNQLIKGVELYSDVRGAGDPLAFAHGGFTDHSVVRGLGRGGRPGRDGVTTVAPGDRTDAFAALAARFWRGISSEVRRRGGAEPVPTN